MMSMQTFYTQIFSGGVLHDPYAWLLARLSRARLAQIQALKVARRWEIWG